ncbi:hypothetical protein M1563_05060 [Patescibacteria group bacterium]|nr:hypothetical protein [Patescibacteria group bacterium]MCL5409431.1 hypothetical protein [Patescibacteria group bacterium]
MGKGVTPQEILAVGFDFEWDEQKLWKLNLPLEEMELEELVWHFDLPFWSTGGSDYNFKPIWVLQEPEKYPERMTRVMKADLNCPLDIMFWKGRWVLLDGLHRLTKAKILGQKTVKVRKVPLSAISKIKK